MDIITSDPFLKTKHGRLTVTSFAEKRRLPCGKNAKYYNCLCDCGNSLIVAKNNLGRSTNSCGCLKSETTTARNYKHGQGSNSNKVHKAWCEMKARCKDTKSHKYTSYTDRGIFVAEEWLEDFQAFYDHIGDPPSPQHSVDRINNNLGYIPGNVRWATDIEQANNKTTNVYLEFNGQTKTRAEWAREYNIPYFRLRYRLQAGWPMEKALSI